MTERDAALPGIVVLTGVGVTRESGPSTCRDPGGAWQRVRIEDAATPEAFRRDPARVHAFHDARRARPVDPAERPDAAHGALAAELDRRWPGELPLATRNMDESRERAGAERLLHMHGDCKEARCLRCGAVRPSMPPRLADRPSCAACGEAGGLRPDAMWFCGMPRRGTERIEAALARCGLFVAIGASRSVYPAAGFVAGAHEHGARTVESDGEPSEGSALFDEARHGPATELVPHFTAALLRGGAPA